MTQQKDDWGPWEGGNVRASLRAHGEQPSLVWSLFQNNFYVVSLTPFQCDWGWCVHVVIRCKHAGNQPLWSNKQRVKDELLGPQRVAIEVFPAAKDLVDQADAYHLWVLPENFRLPFSVEAISE